MLWSPCWNSFFSDVKQTTRDGSFKASKLEKAIKEIVKEQTAQ